MNPQISVTLYRDDWILLAGWITAKQSDEWEPGFVAKLVAAVKDAAGPR